MKKNFKWSILMLLCAVITFSSCSKEDDAVPTTLAMLNIEMPLGLDNMQLKNATATLTNVETNKVITVSSFDEHEGSFSGNVESLEEGTYNVHLTGDITFTKNGISGSSKVDQTTENVKINGTNNRIKFSVNTFTAEGGFLISEIFYTGTTTPEGKQYSDDQYIIISNNSDVTLYADSIALVESAFMTVDKQDYTPDIMKDTMSVEAIYMIPGNGHQVPVDPGKSLVLAVNAKNHTEANPNSFDLSKADFEFYDESSNPNFLDEDNTNVPNLDKWYCYTATWFGLHNRGFRSYAIARMHGDKESYLANNFYKPAYTFVFGEYSFDMSTDAYKIPNTWILDAVNLSIESSYEWQVTSAALDAGWAHCGSVDHDKNRYNKAVVRKTTSNGRWIDTNNSSNDFNSDAVPTYLVKK